MVTNTKATLTAELLKDPTFKRYTTVIDRALGAFDTIVEWPDYIAFLGRLHKVLSLSMRMSLSV